MRGVRSQYSCGLAKKIRVFLHPDFLVAYTAKKKSNAKAPILSAVPVQTDVCLRRDGHRNNRHARHDAVIDNSGPFANTKAQIDEQLRKLQLIK